MLNDSSFSVSCGWDTFCRLITLSSRRCFRHANANVYSRKLKKSPSDHIHARYYQRQTNPIIIIGFMKRKFRDKISLSVDVIGLSLCRKTSVPTKWNYSVSYNVYFNCHASIAINLTFSIKLVASKSLHFINFIRNNIAKVTRWKMSISKWYYLE